ncbi:MAG: gliding motility-associated C-terminal domain-containing protein, partial [Bacteroidia bacterium]|nr:gliding motility-associated C-terminal domain-containing protein [Bacteroidia bacterium]
YSRLRRPRQVIAVAVDPPNPLVEFVAEVLPADSCITNGEPSPSGRINLELTGNNQNGPYTFAWTKDEDPSFTASSQNLSGLTSGSYRVTITDGGGCITSAGPFVIDEQLKIITDARTLNDTVIAKGSELVLWASATDAVNFRWTDADGNVLYDGPDSSFTILPEQNTPYTVVITNDRNCSETLSFHVELSSLVIYIPNTFSPNGDSANELFQVYGTGIQSIELKVFNRLGQILYTTQNWIEGENTSAEIGWDGTFQGKPQESGNYVWSITGKFINNAVFKDTGTVLLVR